MSTPNRDQIPEAMTWDLARLYPNDERWEAEFAAFANAEAPLLELKGRLAESAATLATAFELEDDLARRIEKLYTYAHLKADEDTTNATYQAMQQRAESRYVGLGAALAWITPEVLAMPDERFAACRDDPALAPWQRTLDELARRRPHVLDEAGETLLSQAAEPLEAASRAFRMLSNADLRFPAITTEDGEEVEVTQGNFVRFLESRDRRVRRDAFAAVYDTYDKCRHTCASLLDSQLRKQIFLARAHRFDSAIEASLHQDNVDLAVYDNLVASVRRALPAYHRYVGLRRRVLGVDDLDMYDQYVPLVAGADLEVPWDRACDWARAAVRPLGEAYAEAMEGAFGERWIDVLESRGKRSGGYSSGCFDSPPYILLNYQDNVESAYTLIHELGHSMHSLFSNRSQPHAYARYKILVAEVASTTNEMLLTHYLQDRQDDPAFRAYVLNKLCDQFKGTVFRQTMFAEFERQVHARAEAGQALTADAIGELYYALNKEWYGPDVQADERIGREWARIPHFYYNFYVYKYATGFAAAQVFADMLLSGDGEAVQRYLGFLHAGASRDPLDILAEAGCDLRQPEVVDRALEGFAATVEKLAAALDAMD